MRFTQFIQEEIFLDEELLLEEKDDPNKIGGASNDTKGVLHELLVGRHLNGGEHLALHPNIDRETPKQAHDRLKKQIHPKDYSKIAKRAESAANDIKSRLDESHPGHKISGVFWTSKKGDTEKVTGVPAAQTEDTSDIYVTTHHKSKGIKHHGISLKVTDKSDKNVPSSSLGAEHSGAKARELFVNHQKQIKTLFPDLTKVKKKDHHKNIAAARKEWAKANPKKHEKIKSLNRELLKSVAHHHAAELQQKINDGKHKEVLDHIRNLLGAKTTPAQKAGKATYQKHTSYETAKGTKHHSIDPSTHYESLLKNPKNIEIDSSGGSVNFYIKHPKTGERIKLASQSHKFDSQSDPLSNLKSAGKSTVPDQMLKENFEESFQNILLESRNNQQKIMAAAERAAAVFGTSQKSKQRDKARVVADAEARQESEQRKAKTANREALSARKEARAQQSETDLRWIDYGNKVYRGVTGRGAVSQLAKGANLEAPNQFKMEEEAPANAMGTAGISGLDNAVDVGIAGRDMLLTPGPLRRPPPKMFGGKRVFTVPSKDYYKATLGRRKGQHWRSMVNGTLGEEIRQYALENKEAPIIVEDETTGAMMYLRYGKR